jgi:ubiquinone/menaquinone biosynthesis C-methylase UbiE
VARRPQSQASALQLAQGEVLEVVVGTGLYFAHYRSDVNLTALDISPKMLARTARRVANVSCCINVAVGDVEDLPYPDATFDTVTAACTFCSVGDPVRGLREVKRVLKPTGRVLLYEHVRPGNAVLGRLADLLTPLTRTVFGPSNNRRTEDNALAAGVVLLEVRRRGIWHEIVAAPPRSGSQVMRPSTPSAARAQQ